MYFCTVPGTRTRLKSTPSTNPATAPPGPVKSSPTSGPWFAPGLTTMGPKNPAAKPIPPSASTHRTTGIRFSAEVTERRSSSEEEYQCEAEENVNDDHAPVLVCVFVAPIGPPPRPGFRVHRAAFEGKRHIEREQDTQEPEESVHGVTMKPRFARDHDAFHDSGQPRAPTTPPHEVVHVHRRRAVTMRSGFVRPSCLI